MPIELRLLGDDEERLLPLNELLLRLGDEDERLLPLNELLLRLDDEDERLLPLKELLLRLDDDELLDRLLLMELLWLLPPPRLPPPRCARAGVVLSARAAITRTIAFEVFISLLLSCFCLFSLFSVRNLLGGDSFLFLLQKYEHSAREIPKMSHNFP